MKSKSVPKPMTQEQSLLWDNDPAALPMDAQRRKMLDDRRFPDMHDIGTKPEDIADKTLRKAYADWLKAQG